MRPVPLGSVLCPPRWPRRRIVTDRGLRDLGLHDQRHNLPFGLVVGFAGHL